MGLKTKRRNILYCSAFRSHRAQRELVGLAADNNCRVYSLPWEESSNGSYTGPFPVDGVISHLDPRFAPRLHAGAGGVPHVTMHAQTAELMDYPGVVCDHGAAGRMVAEHFLSLGFTRFAAFVDGPKYHTFDMRLQGFSNAICEAGLPPPTEIRLNISSKTSYEKTLVELGKALNSLCVPLAIMAANDRVAVKIMDACDLNNYSMPAQVAVCGFDNDPLTCDVAPVPLSSVDTHPELQAREAFHLLLSMMKGRTVSTQPTVIPPLKLVVRRSSGLQAQASGTTARAIAYIHEQALQGDVSIPDITNYLRVSRSKLFLAFQKSLAMTPLQYMTKLRIEKAKQLLEETELKINEIRPKCGFASDYQMYRAFKRTTGAPPGRFRHKS